MGFRPLLSAHQPARGTVFNAVHEIMDAANRVQFVGALSLGAHPWTRPPCEWGEVG
jgi:hypothetical protein